jgi:hypothetical protein
MKNKTALPGKIVLMALFVCAVVAGTNLWRSSAGDNSKDMREQYIARLRDGLSELDFATPSDVPGQSHSSVRTLTKYIHRRSGLALSRTAQARLLALEEKTSKGTARRLPAGKLDTIITQAMCERIAALTDQEIDSAIEVMRGFDAPDLPGSYRGGRSHIKIRASWGGPKVGENLMARMRYFREQAKNGDTALRLLLGGFISKEVESRARLLNEALPPRFVQGGALKSSSTTEVTPAQAFLVVYSVVSDDPLLDSEVNLQKQLQHIRASRAKYAGHYPSSDGHRAYGTNGYLHSSPLDILLNEQTIDRLLQLIEEGGAK